MTALHNKHVLVTGGASGIGRLIVLGCARVGASVTIWDLDAEGADRVALEAAEAGASSAHAFACDVSDREQVYARADETRAAAGDVDVLVNNAGIVSGAAPAGAPGRADRAHLRRQHAGAVLDDQGVPAGDEDPRERPRRHRGLRRGPHRHRPRDRLRGQQVRGRGLQRVACGRSCGAAPAGVRTTVVCPFYIDTGMFQGVKTRFPLLLPVLKEQQVADRVLKAIRRNTQQVQMPWMVQTLPMMRLLPVWAFDELADFFGLNNAMDAFTGRSPAKEA